MAPTEAFVFDAIRTPRGRGKTNGSLHTVKPIDLVVGLIHETLARNAKLDPNRVDDLVLGCVTPVGDQGANIARIAALKAGLPDTVPGMQLNRFCSSALDAVNIAAQKVLSGWEEARVRGWYRVDVARADRLRRGGVGDGSGDELRHRVHTAGRQRRPDRHRRGFQPRGRRRLRRALPRARRCSWEEGRFKRAVVPVTDMNENVVLDHDEHIRAGTTVESLAKLKPSFQVMGEMGGFDAVALQKYHWLEKIDHVHTPGNSSGIVDGASLLAIGSERIGDQLGMTPRAKIVAAAACGSEPTIMLVGPAPASRKALEKAGLTIDDIDLVEMNEAFAAVVLRFAKDMDLDIEKVNVNGGAIAMGHPLGATGGMILGTLIDELHRTGGRYGLATLCIGGGMGVATMVEAIG